MKLTYLYITLALILCVIAIVVIQVVLLTTRIKRYAQYWDSETSRTDLKNPIIYVALGDSAAQGIGASSPEKGYVGLIASRLEKQRGKPVLVINLSKSGAKVGDVLSTQIPQLKGLKPEVITIEIGANDIQSFDAQQFESQTQKLMSQLPPNTIISDIPYFGGRSRILNPSWGQRVIAANQILHKTAAENHFKLAPLYEQTKAHNTYPTSYAIDYFHPNNAGYKTWADVFWAQIQAQ